MDEPKRRWGRYECVGEIASGGMATVYLARNLDSNRLAAVKALHPHLMSDEEVVQNFVDENHIVSRICHPNVVPVLEVAQNDAGHYQAMEYVDGVPLGRLLVYCIRGGHWLSIPACVRLVWDVLEGLDAAHELKNNAGELTGVVHRDVGPANILIDVFGMARVIDFGVATMAVRYTAPGSDNIKGRLAYMAPEQAKTPKDIDRRADLFSVGVVLWELLAARRLFKAKSESETLKQLLTMEIPSLSIIREDVEPELEVVVATALNRDPSQRYQTARELIDALREAVEVDDVETRRELAELVGEAFGEELAERRALGERSGPSEQRLGAPIWTEKSSIAPPGATVSTIAPPPETSSSRKWLGWVAAVLLLLLGAGVWRSQSPRYAAGKPAQSTVVGQSVQVPAVAETSTGQVAKPEPAAAQPAETASPKPEEPEGPGSPSGATKGPAPASQPAGGRYRPPAKTPTPISDVDLANPYR